MSIIVDPGAAVATTSLTFAAGVAACAAVSDLGVAAHIKWPNDLLVGRRKLAGILCEARTRGGTLGTVVLGVGLNVNQTEEELPRGATSCRVERGWPIDRELLLANLLNRLEKELERLAAGGHADLLRRWQEMSILHEGHAVEVVADGSAHHGVSDGIDADGALRVITSAGERLRVLGGGVRFAGVDAVSDDVGGGAPGHADATDGGGALAARD